MNRTTAIITGASQPHIQLFFFQIVGEIHFNSESGPS